jgi:hypothetical protein
VYGVSIGASLIWALLEIPLFLVNQVAVPALRYFIQIPIAIVRNRKSTTWTIEAVSWWPHEQRFSWTADASEKDRVLAEIAAGISEGRWAQPHRSVFRGQTNR